MTVGVVWQPSFFPGFSASLDYYKIRIRDQITRPGTALIIQQCEDSGGTGPTCEVITRPFPFSNSTAGNFPATISDRAVQPGLLSIQEGIDYEFSYRMDVGPGHWTCACSATTPRTSPRPRRRARSRRSWRGRPPVYRKTVWTARRTTLGPVTSASTCVTSARCTTRCSPTCSSTNNELDPVTYLNANVSYDIRDGPNPISIYLSGSNLTDKFVFAPQNNAQPTEFYPSFQSQYDVVGTYYVAGIHFKF